MDQAQTRICQRDPSYSILRTNLMAALSGARTGCRWPHTYRILYALIVLLVGCFYLWCVQAANPPFEWRHDKVEYYDLLGRGLAEGHLYLPIEPPPQLLA